MAESITKVGLDLFITGICLFVPVQRTKRIVVLMPQTRAVCAHGRRGGGGGEEQGGGGHGDGEQHEGDGGGERAGHAHHIEPHRSVIAIHEKHLDSTLCTEKVGDHCIIDLANWSLTLSNGTRLEDYSLGGVYGLNRGGFNRRAKSSFGPELQARVDLTSGTFVGSPNGKKFWIDGKKVPMSNYVHWEIKDFEPKLTLTCLRCGETREIALLPADSTSIELLIQHVPKGEMGPPKSKYDKPDPKTPMHHFFALDQLLEDGHDPIDVPVWEDEDGDDSDPSPGAPRGGNPYTCMPGEGGPGDDGP